MLWMIVLVVSLVWTVADASNSFLDQLLQSLSKLAASGELMMMEEENDGNGEPVQVHLEQFQQQQPGQPQQQQSQQQAQQAQQQAQQQAAYDQHFHATRTALAPSHEQRLALYQHALQQHYYASTLQRFVERQAQPNPMALQKVHDLVDYTYQMYFRGYEIELPPSSTMAQEQDEEDNDQTAQQQQQEQQQQQQQEQEDYSSILTSLHGTTLASAFPPFPASKAAANRHTIRAMFQTAYDAYLYHGWPAGEVTPLSCRPHDFSLVPLPGLTLLDSLEALLVLGGNTTEFARAVERLRELDNDTSSGGGGLWNVDQNVSLFETNIRVLGGLLSAHQMAEAWLPPVLILKEQVFVTEHVEQQDDDSLVVRQRVRTGRDDAVLGVCLVAEDDEDDDDDDHQDQVSSSSSEQHPTTNKNDKDSVHMVASSSSSLDPGVTTTASASSSFNYYGSTTSSSNSRKKKEKKTNVWKNATHTKIKLSPDRLWSYDGLLLDLALDLGHRLLPAFDTPTGIPYGTVHLQTGIPPHETPIASLAGSGTLVLEFTLLSKLTGQLEFEQAAQRAARALWVRQSLLYLLGKHIDIQTGAWTETLSGIGSNSDSFTEYMAKQYFLFANRNYPIIMSHDDSSTTTDHPHSSSSSSSSSFSFLSNWLDHDFWILFVTVYSGIVLELRRGDWYVDADMQAGARVNVVVGGRRILEALMAFFPGLQVSVGEWSPAARSLNAFFLVREHLGFLPERFQMMDGWKVDHGAGAGKHLLRPELLESSYLLHRAVLGTQRSSASSLSSSLSSSGWMWASDFAVTKLQQFTPAPCGFASLADVRPHLTGGMGGTDEAFFLFSSSSSSSQDPPPRRKTFTPNNVRRMDEMPSFFLTETLKYLYLTFDPDNILHQDQQDQTRNWIFTTEAHPIHNGLHINPYNKNKNNNKNKNKNVVDAQETTVRVPQTNLLHDDNNIKEKSGNPAADQHTNRHQRQLNATSSTGFDVEDGLHLLERLLTQRVKGQPIEAFTKKQQQQQQHGKDHHHHHPLLYNNNHHHPQNQNHLSNKGPYKESNSQKTAYHKAMHNVKTKISQEEKEATAHFVDNDDDAPHDLFFDYPGRSLIQPMISVDFDNDDDDDDDDATLHSLNEAHYTWSLSGLDSGWHLRQACPNVFAPELLWMHALHGGAFDYVPRFVPLSSNLVNNALLIQELLVPQHNNEWPLTSTQALTYWASWPVVYPTSTNHHHHHHHHHHSMMMHSNEAGIAWWDTSPERAPQGACRLRPSTTTSSSSTTEAFGDTTGTATPPQQQQQQQPRKDDSSSIARHQFKARHTREGIFRSSNSNKDDDDDGDDGLTGVQTEMGHFHIKPFDAGSGFAVEHVETGQSLTCTFVNEERPDAAAFFMVHTIFPALWSTTADHDPVDEKDTMDRPHQESDKDTQRQQPPSMPLLAEDRVVIMADTKGNSFSCDVELLQQTIATHNNQDGTSQENVKEYNEDVTVVFRVPCTPGLFGPTHMAHLATSGELIVEGALFEPDPEDLFGCHSAADQGYETDNEYSSEDEQCTDETCGVTQDEAEREEAGDDNGETCPNHVVHFVHRGSCSFIEKSVNLKHNSNADGVIVINTDPNEVFIMSYGPDDMEYVENPHLLPVTVLISGDDGSDLLDHATRLQSRANDRSASSTMSVISVRIALRRQSTEQTDHSIMTISTESLRFPLVKASPTVLRIFSRAGWGIQAMQQQEGYERAHWHLQLLRHQFDSDSLFAGDQGENGAHQNRQEMEKDGIQEGLLGAKGRDDDDEEEEEEEEDIDTIDEPDTNHGEHEQQNHETWERFDAAAHDAQENEGEGQSDKQSDEQKDL